MYILYIYDDYTKIWFLIVQSLVIVQTPMLGAVKVNLNPHPGLLVR